MKKHLHILIAVPALMASAISFAATKDITIETKKVGDAIHWSPDKVEVSQGETVKFTVKHDVEGGFDFHGFFIPVLKISEQVNRHKPLTLEVKIPSDLKLGEHPIGCQFHPKHVPAKMLVKPAPTKG